MNSSWRNTGQVRLLSRLAYFYAPVEKGGAYCFAHVGRYVGRSVGMSVGRYVGIP